MPKSVRCIPRSSVARRSSWSVGVGRSVMLQGRWVTEQSLRNCVKHDELDLRERDDGLASVEREELRELRRARSSAWSRSAICSNELWPSSRGRPRPGEGVSDHSDHLGGAGQWQPGLPGVRAVGRALRKSANLQARSHNNSLSSVMCGACMGGLVQRSAYRDEIVDLPVSSSSRRCREG